jgi:hypothetical protein
LTGTAAVFGERPSQNRDATAKQWLICLYIIERVRKVNRSGERGRFA